MTLNLHFAGEHYGIPYCFEVEQYGFYYTVAQIIIKTMTGCIDGLILLPSNVIYLEYSKWNYCLLSKFIVFFIFIGSL